MESWSILMESVAAVNVGPLLIVPNFLFALRGVFGSNSIFSVITCSRAFLVWNARQMTCPKPRSMAPRRHARKPTYRRTPNTRRTRATREYVQTPMVRARGRAAKRRGFATAAGAAGLMPCTRKYVASLVDPSGEEGRGACVPAGFPMPSQKARAFARGVMHCTGAPATTGEGFIYFAPPLANDTAAAQHSQAASAGTSSTAFTAFTNQQSVLLSKLPYSTAQLAANSVEGRFVSGCIRVRYAGTEDTRSGIITLFEDPDHLGVGGLSANGISNFENATKERVNGDGTWSQINWSGPCKQDEQEYVTTPAYAAACLVIAISGAPVGAPFEYEVWVNVEYMGRDAIGKTANEIDAKGMDASLTVTKGFGNSSNKTFGPQIAREVVSGIGKVFQAKEGGTAFGNAAHAGVTAFNPALGRIYGGLRAGINRLFGGTR